MINGRYLASRTIKHLSPIIDKLGHKQAGRRFQRVSEKSVSLDEVHFSFEADKDSIEVRIDKKDVSDFYEKIKATRTRVFWKDDRLHYLKKKRDKYRTYLSNIKITENGEGNVYFNANLKTKNEDKAFFAVLNCITKPVLYNLSEVKQ